jgi:hypothetical protein
MKHGAHRLPQILTLGENTAAYQVFSDTESSPYMSKLSRRFDDEDEGGCIRLSGEKP